MAHPKYEGAIIVPTGGYSFIVNDGAPQSVPVAAGSYYLTQSSTGMLPYLAAAIGIATGDAWTATLDDTANSATGKITLSSAGTFTAITWTSTALRDALGFTGSETVSGNSVTAAGHSRYLWLPDTGRGPGLAPEGASGMPESDGVISLSPSGHTKALSYNIRYRDVIAHQYLSGRKVWTQYVTHTNEALERFYADVIGLGVPFRYFPARETDSTYVDYVADAGGMASLNVTAMDPGWTSSAVAQWGWTCPVRKKVT
jgi:hypothetical protein